MKLQPYFWIIVNEDVECKPGYLTRDYWANERYVDRSAAVTALIEKLEKRVAELRKELS